MYHRNSVIDEQFYKAIAYYRLSKEDRRKSETDSMAVLKEAARFISLIREGN